MNAPRALLPWVLFGGSVAANMILIARGPASESGSTALRAEVHGDAAAAVQASRPSADSAAALPAEAWKNVYAEDLSALTRNLRAAGLPDRLVRAIVGAEINERFKAREDALKPKQAPSNYWETQDFYERNAGDRTVFRVRIGPFDERAGADALQAQVQAAGLEAAVVRTQR